VQESGVDFKVGLYVVCLFCFWSLAIPLAVGFVNRATFLASVAATLVVLAGFFVLLSRRLTLGALGRRLVLPGIAVVSCFLAFYAIGLIPPVPIAARAMGVYHLVERQGDAYLLHHERPRWKFWLTGDQDFVARPGDRIYVFVAIFSPARFADTVFVRWRTLDAAGQWQESDRIPIAIVGGRSGGFRGYTSKENYSEGAWRVDVETADGRQIGRINFTVARADADPARTFVTETY
jgi:hypothetical protein